MTTATATTDLNRALLNIAAAGLRTHCSDPTLSQLWLLDHPGERREAVKLCRHCPVIGECRQAADARGSDCVVAFRTVDCGGRSVMPTRDDAAASACR